jgi:hypothetical protein
MQLDLVDEMQWEDVIEFETLEDAGFEETSPVDDAFSVSIYAYTEWFYDGDSSAFSVL